MAAMFGWLSDAISCASRLKRASRSGSALKASGRTFNATSRFSLESRRAVHLAHSAFANLAEDAIGADAIAD